MTASLYPKRTEPQLIETIISFLKENGSFRIKPMCKAIRAPYVPTLAALERLESEGVTVRVPDGYHRRMPVLAWKLAGQTNVRVSFGGAQTLQAMQQAARSRQVECHA